MRRQPSLDLHAHVDVALPAPELRELGVIFAACRSAEETRKALLRTDDLAVWGVGCHPAVSAAHESFDAPKFRRMVESSAFVSEIGLDGKATVPLARQIRTLRSILQILRDVPRISSVHSYAATADVLALLAAEPCSGVVLHWWLGTEAETERALELGCYFSVNQASVRKPITRRIPLDRVLTETDHPFGDRSMGVRARPGEVSAVEDALARMHDLPAIEIRARVWRNLADLVSEVPEAVNHLPRPVRRLLLAA